MSSQRPHRFIPDGDIAFRDMASAFARSITRNPGRFHLRPEDAAEIQRAVDQFVLALATLNCEATRNKPNVRFKDQCRAAAEQVIRRYGRILRADPRLSETDKHILWLAPRERRVDRMSCPTAPPAMQFLGSTHGTHAAGFFDEVHLVRFWDAQSTTSLAKPSRAVRLELFVELVAPNERPPKHPGELSGGRPWYLRSYSRSPARVEFPIANAPMLIVYWGRWADTQGNVGRFSRPLSTRVEGWSNAHNVLAMADRKRRVELEQLEARSHPPLLFGEPADEQPVLPPPRAQYRVNRPLLDVTPPPEQDQRDDEESSEAA